MKGSLISLVLTALLVIILQVAADSTDENILSAIASQNNTDEGANGCARLQCRVIDDGEADFFIDQQAVGLSRMLANTNTPGVTSGTSDRNKPAGCPKIAPDGKYSTCTGGGSPQLNGCKSIFCDR